jgi:two-component system chemotaxis response regulator CheB
LIVDDAVVVRKALSDALSDDPDLEVVGTASNGRIALGKLQTLCPDVILLDIEMPEMNGLEAIPEIRKLRPLIPIIIFSALTERGAEATLDALVLGATDYVTKPSNTDMAPLWEGITRELIPKIKSLCHISRPESRSLASDSMPVRTDLHVEIRARPLASLTVPPQIIAIGVSTGGPDALAKVLPALPAEFPLHIVIAQHMPPIFTTLLAKRLATKCSVPVLECQPGHCLSQGASGSPQETITWSSGKKEASFVCTLTKGRVKTSADLPWMFYFAQSRKFLARNLWV